MKRRLLFSLIMLFLLCAGHIFGQGQSMVWVDDDFNSGTPGWGVTHFAAIQDGINAVATAGTVNVANGTYVQAYTLDISKGLIFDGESESGVIINTTAVSGYGIHLVGDGITMNDFTVIPNSASPGLYALKADPQGAVPCNGLTLDNITINASKKSAFDIHGYNTVALSNLTATNTVSGNGIAISGCDGVTFANCATSGNTWGGIAIYVSTWVSRGSSNIIFDFSANSVDEWFYVEDESGLTNTNITVQNWTYGIENAYNPPTNMLQYTDKAMSYALQLGAGLNVKYSNMRSVIYNPSLTNWYVGTGMSIQSAIDASIAGDIINVNDGTFTENVNISKSLTLRSISGKDVTTIQGIAASSLGSIFIPGGVNNVTIGGVNQGFHVIGIDSPNAGIEFAAIYLQAGHSNITIEGNEIEAAGDAGLSGEWNAAIDNIVVNDNIFSGKTYIGTNPAGNGFGEQFTLWNVPRQLCVLGGGEDVTNSLNVTFTNNEITGTAGGYNTSAQEQGNTLVTIDVVGADINGNNFSGTTTRYSSSLRVRGSATNIDDNTFSSAGLTTLCNHICFGNGSAIVGAANNTLELVANNNTFDKAAYITSPASSSQYYMNHIIGASIYQAVSGQTVKVLPGTYVEQVYINKEGLVVDGSGKTNTFINSPANLTLSFATPGVKKPVVFVENVTDCTVSNMTVNGDGKGNANNAFVGIGFWNAGGTLDNVDVIGVRDTPFSGAQHGVAVYAYNNVPGTYAIDIHDVNVSDFQKNAFALSGNGLTVDMDGVNVTGAGSTSVTAQNGIQIGYGANATVSNSSVTGIHYVDNVPPIPDWSATAILLYDGGTVNITNTDVLNSQTGIYFINTAGSFNNSSVTSPVADVWANGVDIAADPPVPQRGRSENLLRNAVQPILEDYTPVAERTVLAVEVDNSDFTGVNFAGNYAIGAYSQDEITMNITNCVINGWDYAISAYEDAGIVNGTANNNDLSDNIFGYDYNGTTWQDAENNWWGDPTGPKDAGTVDGAYNPDGLGSEVSEYVDYDPWCANATGTCVPATNTETEVYNADQGVYYYTIQDAISGAEIGDKIEIIGDHNTQIITVNKGLKIAAGNGGARFNGRGDRAGEGFVVDLPADEEFILGDDPNELVVENWTTGVLVESSNLGDVTIHGVKFLNNALSVNNLSTVQVKAEHNYWGSINYNEVSAQVSGSVDFLPYCDEAFMNCYEGPGPVTTIPTMTDVCPNLDVISVPVTVTNFNNVGGISLILNYSGAFTLSSVVLNPTIIEASVNTTVTGKVIIGFHSTVPVNLVNGATLFTMNFDYTGDPCPVQAPSILTLTWDNTDPIYCEYSTPEGYIFWDNGDADFIDGSVSVQDDTPPTFTCPANITLDKGPECTVNDTPTGAAGDVTNEADNCSTGLNATYEDQVTLGNCGDYIITRTWHLQDDCGNAAPDQVQIITVEDNTPPTIVCPANLEVFMNNGCTWTGVGLGSPTLGDNCSTPTAVAQIAGSTIDPFAYAFGEGLTTVTWIATDGCGNTNSCTQTVLVKYNSIAGSLKLYKSTPVAMQGAKVYINGTQYGTVGADGSFSIANVCAGTYNLSVVHSNPASSINATDAAQVNYWAVGQYGFYPIEYVRYLAGDVNEEHDVTPTDALRIQQYFVYGGSNHQFDRGPWSYWFTGAPVSGNPHDLGTLGVNVSGGPLNGINLFGMVTGDFNSSYSWTIPVKGMAANVMLTYGDSKQTGASTETTLPLSMVNDSELSAVSLVFNFPADLMEVMDVTMKDNNGRLDWAVVGDELRIGWNSSVPVSFAAGDDLVSIRLKTSESFVIGKSIRLAITNDPINELADGSLNVILDAGLSIDILESSTLGTGDQLIAEALTLKAFPNPFANNTQVSYTLPSQGHVTLEISNMFGIKVATLVDELQTAGSYSLKLDALQFAQGVYMATIKLNNPSDDMVKTIKIICNH